MKLLSLLTVAIVLIGITTQAFACNYERMSRIPNYAKFTTPKITLNIPQAYGICVAPNGNFAIMSHNKKIRIYNSCGKQMEEVDLSKHALKTALDCAFTDRSLFVTDYYGKNVYELSTTGKFVRIFATGSSFLSIAACQDQLYITTGHTGRSVYVYDTNGKKIRTISVPHGSRGIVVGIDGNLRVSNGQKQQVYTYTREGKQVGEKTYEETRYANCLAMDIAGNLLIADHSSGKVEVYSSCGAHIKTIRTGTKHSIDVDIANDGTVMVTDSVASKVFLYY